MSQYGDRENPLPPAQPEDGYTLERVSGTAQLIVSSVSWSFDRLKAVARAKGFHVKSERQDKTGRRYVRAVPYKKVMP